jgi:environmental stress-induced protein Ves
MSAPVITLIHAASLVAVPWKNGGGVTREIAAEPQGAPLDAFTWRISVANVSAPGAFSTFAGIDRTLVLIDGEGMRLHEASGKTHVLAAPLDMTAFAGETPIDATLDNGPTRDFNVMVRRGRARASVQAHRGPASLALANGVTLLHCVRGELHITPGDAAAVTLGPGDTLRLDASRALACQVVAQGAEWLAVHIDITQ